MSLSVSEKAFDRAFGIDDNEESIATDTLTGELLPASTNSVTTTSTTLIVDHNAQSTSSGAKKGQTQRAAFEHLSLPRVGAKPLYETKQNQGKKSIVFTITKPILLFNR